MTDSLSKGTRLPGRHLDEIGINDVVGYLEIAGDDNPIHTDPEMAHLAGLDDVPVPGMQVMGIVAGMLERWVHTGEVRRLNVNFVSPVFVGGELTTAGRVVALDLEAKRAIIRVSARQSGRITVMGEAEIALRDP
jgi:acyl dehydratase